MIITATLLLSKGYLNLGRKLRHVKVAVVLPPHAVVSVLFFDVEDGGPRHTTTRCRLRRQPKLSDEVVNL